jgi:hypothetical protein
MSPRRQELRRKALDVGDGGTAIAGKLPLAQARSRPTNEPIRAGGTRKE